MINQNATDTESNDEVTTNFPWKLVGIIFLLLLIIALPLAISIMDIGTPVNGFSGFPQSV